MKLSSKNAKRIFGVPSTSLFLLSSRLLAASSHSTSTSTSDTFTYQVKLLNTDGPEALNDEVKTRKMQDKVRVMDFAELIDQSTS